MDVDFPGSNIALRGTHLEMNLRNSRPTLPTASESDLDSVRNAFLLTILQLQVLRDRVIIFVLSTTDTSYLQAIVLFAGNITSFFADTCTSSNFRTSSVSSLTLPEIELGLSVWAPIAPDA